MIFWASVLASVLAPWASSVLAMSMAPWWCWVIICSHILSNAAPLACSSCCMSCVLIMPGIGLPLLMPGMVDVPGVPLIPGMALHWLSQEVICWISGSWAFSMRPARATTFAFVVCPATIFAMCRACW